MSYYHLLLASALMGSGLLSFSSDTTAMTLTQAIPLNSFSHPHTHTHTHTHTQETKPAPLSIALNFSVASIKVAGICFIGFGGCDDNSGFNKGDSDYSFDPVDMCKKEGFSITSCSLPTFPSGQCPFHVEYFTKCVEDKPRACMETGYISSCPDGQIAETSCPYDNSYKKCKCDPCSGFEYTYEQATAQGFVINGSCNSCSTVKYNRKENSCAGYQSCECGGATGASDCYSGSVQKFNSCKPCCTYECSLSFCPPGALCTKEDCSGKYCISGCAAGYADIETFWCSGALKCWMNNTVK